MSTVKYSVYETPNPKGDGKKSYHVRPVTERAVKLEHLALEISEMSTFSSADIKGMLDAFSTMLKQYLAMGATVELEGIGLFSISLSCPKNIEDPSKINASNIRFKKVNFKSSGELHNAFRGVRFSRAKENKKDKPFTEAERQKRILNYIKKNGNIQSSICMGINNCTRYIALKDLKNLVSSNQIEKHGVKSSSFYLLKE